MKQQSLDLDEDDLRLLRAMQKDASASQAALAEQAGVSPSLVSRRLARLREAGALRAIVGLVDAPRVGLTCAALIRIRPRAPSPAAARAWISPRCASS